MANTTGSPTSNTISTSSSSSSSSSSRNGTIDKRTLLFPICSGTLGLICVGMQIVAVATPYWAHFKRERYTEILDDGLRTDPLYEEGHYGLWTICLTVFDGKLLPNEDCITNVAHFHPSSWRIFAGIIATINVVLSLLFLAAIPFQVRHLRSGTPVYCKYKTLTRIKMVLSIVGVICAIMAAVLFGIHSHHKHYKEPKGWSFGLQIIVIVVEVFLLIASSAENVVATRIDQASPEPQYLFTLAGINKKTSEMHNNDPFKFPSLNPTLSLSSNAGNLLRSAMKKTNEENKLTTKDNPIFIDSDNETYHLEKKKQVDVTSVIQVPVTINPNNKPDFSIKIHQNSLPTVENVSEVYSSKDERLKLNNSCTAVGRFRVEKIADIYTVKQTAAAPSEHHTFAYDNQGYNIGSEESLVILG